MVRPKRPHKRGSMRRLVNDAVQETRSGGPQCAWRLGGREWHPFPETGNAPAARNCYLLVCSTRLTMQTNSSIIPTITNVPLGAGFALSKVPK